VKPWTPPPCVAWSLAEQLAAAGLEVPTVADGAYHFLAARLIAHQCPRADCGSCREARRLGWRTLRVTKDEISNGVALDAVGRALWEARNVAAQGGLFT